MHQILAKSNNPRLSYNGLNKENLRDDSTRISQVCGFQALRGLCRPIWAPAGLFSGNGQIRGLGTNVLQRGPGMESPPEAARLLDGQTEFPLQDRVCIPSSAGKTWCRNFLQ